MPTYEYRCRECGAELEIFQGINDRPKRKCPECSAYKLERLISSGAGIIFKGSGFYETDYKRKGWDSNNKAKEDKKEKKESDRSSDNSNTT